MHYTACQARSLACSLPEGFVVRFGMRYGKPGLEQALEELTDAADRLVVLPMYPQYSSASTGSAFQRFSELLARRRYMPAIRVVPPFYNHAAYIRAEANLIRTVLAKIDSRPE